MFANFTYEALTALWEKLMTSDEMLSRFIRYLARHPELPPTEYINALNTWREIIELRKEVYAEMINKLLTPAH